MTKSMLSEYNVSDSFWAEAINTACHASNRLYCHRLLKKTPYELLIEKKLNISYFQVFDRKYYILRKCTHLSKFQSKCDEGFLLGYSLNSKAYRVYNQNSGLVEETSDVEFDETNGSQEEQENLDDVGNEGLRIAMKNITIGDVKPKYEDYDDDSSPLFHVLPSSSNASHKDQVSNVERNEKSIHQLVNDSLRTSTKDANSQLKIHNVIAKDHSIDQIVGDINKGVQTQSHLASFCEHYSFVSCGEATRIEEALDGPDWVNVMYEELNKFAHNQVWELVKRPSDHNVIGIKWIFRNKQDENKIIMINKTRLVEQGYS
jgi:hypothetical protein